VVREDDMQLDKHIQAGGLNTDDTDYLFPKGDAENRINARVVDIGSGDGGAIVNSPGNALVTSSEYNTNGVDTVIGTIEDSEERRVFFFVHNSGGAHKILCYKYDTNTVVRVLAQENFATNQKGLNFNKSYRVNGVAMSGSLLYFTDNYNEPRRINVDELMPKVSGTGRLNNMKDSQITLIRPQPGLPLTVSKFKDASVIGQFLDNDAFQFTYRYVYYNKEESALGPLSVVVAPNTRQEIEEGYNAIQVTIPTAEIPYFNYNATGAVNLYDVEKVQIVAKSLVTNKHEIVKTFDRETDASVFSNNSFTFVFYNNQAGIALADSTAVKQFDNVPTRSKALEVARNRLFLGNNQIGYASPRTTSLGVTLNIPLSPSTQISKYVKTDSSYQFGIVFSDYAGRKCGVVTNDLLKVNSRRRNNDFSNASNSFNWVLSNSNAVNEIPVWATHCHIVRTHNLRTRYFIQGRTSNIAYVSKDVDGSYTNPVTSYTSNADALRIDISDIFAYGIGYTYNPGDLIKLFWYSDNVEKYTECRIESVIGKYVYASMSKIGDNQGVTTNQLYAFELYSPYVKRDQEVYFEVGASLLITNPGTPNRTYSALNGSIAGDVWVVQRSVVQNTNEIKFDGNVVTGTFPNQPSPGITTRTFDLEGWDKLSGQTTTKLVKRTNTAGLETERFIEVYRPIDGNHGIKALTGLPVSVGDTFSMTIEARGSYNTNYNHVFSYDVILEASDGTSYTLVSDNLSGTSSMAWNGTPGARNSDALGYLYEKKPRSDNATQWRTHSIRSQAAPKSGVIRIYIRGWHKIKDNWFQKELLADTGLFRNISLRVSTSQPVDRYVELMSPSDTLWQNWFTDCGRANIIIEGGSTDKPTSILYSNTIIQGTKINGLSSFESLNEAILDSDAGAINKLVYTAKGDQYGNVMLSICANDAMSLYLGESRIVDNGGDGFLAASPGVIGTIYPLKGGYGSIHPESVVEVSGKVYWFCIYSGCVVRYDNQGLEVISDQKMRNFFQKRSRNLVESGKASEFVIGGFDVTNDEYVLFVPEYSNVEVPKFDDVIRDVVTESFTSGSTVLSSDKVIHAGTIGNVIPFSTNKEACLGTVTAPLYIENGIVVGSKVFTSINSTTGETSFDGDDGWYRIESNLGNTLYLNKYNIIGQNNTVVSSYAIIEQIILCETCFDCKSITIEDANLYNSINSHYVDLLLTQPIGITGEVEFKIYNSSNQVVSTKVVPVIASTQSISYSNTGNLSGSLTIKARVYYTGLSPQPCIEGPAKSVDVFGCTTIVAKNTHATNGANIHFKNCSDNTDVFTEVAPNGELTFCSYNGQYGISASSPSTSVTFTVQSYCSDGLSCGKPNITASTVVSGTSASITFTATPTNSLSTFTVEVSQNQTDWAGFVTVATPSTVTVTLPSSGVWYFRIRHNCGGPYINYSNVINLNTYNCGLNIVLCEVVYDCAINITTCEIVPECLINIILCEEVPVVLDCAINITQCEEVQPVLDCAMNIVLCEEVPPVLDCTLSIVLCEVVPPVLDCTITIDICEVVPYEATVTNVFGYMEPCIGGTIDDHMGASVMLNSAVSVDTSFNVDVTYVYPPMSCSSGGSTYTQSFTVEILQGQTSSSFNACSSGAYFQGGANICSACITYCSNPAVDLSTLGC
jgi:hypothetical protein